MVKVRATALVVLATAFVIAVCPQGVADLIVEGTETLSAPGWTADIHYEVYHGDPLSGTPVVWLDSGANGVEDMSGLYVYLYSVENLDISSYALSRLTLGIEAEIGQYVDIGYLSDSGILPPTDVTLTSSSILFDFDPPDEIFPGDITDTFFVTSYLAPDTVFASIFNHGTAATGEVPGPVSAPEPSSMILLGGLATGLVLARRARSKKRA